MNAAVLEKPVLHLTRLGLVVDEQDAKAVEPVGALELCDGREKHRRVAVGGRSDALRKRHRQADGEARAATRSLAVGGDVAPLQLDEVPRDREPEAEAALRPADAPLRLTKALEHVGQKLHRDALPGVGHLHAELLALAAQGHAHAATARRELHGVVDEVPNDLLKAIGVADDGAGLRIEGDLERDTFGLRGRSHRFDGHLDDFAELDVADLEPQLPGDMRLVSRRSSMSCACEPALRSMISSARSRLSSARVPLRSIRVQPRIALSGVRSS